MQVVRMDENNLGLFLEQLSEGYEQKLKINQMSDVLKERADYLFAVYDKYIQMKLEITSKDLTLYQPRAISFSSDEQLILSFNKLLKTGEPADNVDDVIWQLQALGNFYDFTSQSKTLPPPYLLMKIDNLAMKVVYQFGLRFFGEPAIIRKITANERSNITNRKKMERVAEIIYMAADELKIERGKTSRHDQSRIKKKIRRYLKKNDEESIEVCKKYKLEEIFKNNTPPSIDTIRRRMKGE